MAITIDNAYIQTFESNIRHLAQQSNIRLANHVTVAYGGSEKHNWDRLASTEAATKVGKRVATPTLDPAWTRRVSTPTVKHWADSYAQSDIHQMLIDPKSSLVTSGGMAMGRAKDDLIIAAATGNATDGDGGAVAFPAGQKIGDGTGVISFDMITEVTEKFLSNDIDPDEPKVFVIGPTQMRKLLQLTEATSSDYVNAKALAAMGYLEHWMGYGWIVSNRLLVPGAGELSCLAFTKKALGMNVNQDTWARVAEDPSISFEWRVYLEFTCGVVRVEDEHIVHVHVKDAMT